MNKPNLLFLLSTLIVGGSESKIIRVANALAVSGSSVEIAYLNPPETLRNKIDVSIRVTHLKRRGKYSVSALKRLIRVIREREYVLVAVNLYPLLYALPAAKANSSKQTRVIGLINTAAQTRALRTLGHFYAPFLRRCDRIVFGCEAQLNEWTARYHLPVEKSECIYNGVDHERFAPELDANVALELRRKREIPPEACVVGSIGRLAPEKNFDLLVRAVARLNAEGRDCYLAIAGQGEEMNRLKRLASEVGIASKLRLLGLIDDVRPLLSMLDVFVLPSREVETFSNAALEAMAMAKPVVLSDLGGAGEMVSHGETGMLFKIGDLDTLCEELVSLLDSDQLRRTLGQAARARAIKEFSFAQMVDRYRTFAIW